MNGNYWAEGKTVEIPVDQIGQNATKWTVSAQDQSLTILKMG